MSIIDFRNTKQVFYGGTEIQSVYYMGAKLWEKQVVMGRTYTGAFLSNNVNIGDFYIILDKTQVDRQIANPTEIKQIRLAGVVFNVQRVRSLTLTYQIMITTESTVSVNSSQTIGLIV